MSTKPADTHLWNKPTDGTECGLAADVAENIVGMSLLADVNCSACLASLQNALNPKPAERVSDERLREIVEGGRADLWRMTPTPTEGELMARELLALRSPAEGAEGSHVNKEYGTHPISDARLSEMCNETRWWKTDDDEIYRVVHELRDLRAARQSRPASPLPAELAAEVEKLRGLIAESTQGPWEWDAGDDGHDKSHRYCVVHQPANDLTIADVNQFLGVGVSNAAYIAAANPSALTRILDALESRPTSAAEKHLAALLEAANNSASGHEYMDADGLISAFIAEQERLRERIAELESRPAEDGWVSVAAIEREVYECDEPMTHKDVMRAVRRALPPPPTEKEGT